jgi:hypothetical protein
MPDAREAKPPADEEASKKVETGAGSATRLADDDKPNYDVAWASSQLEFGEKGVFSGAMESVSGTLYSKGKPVSRFAAKIARASKLSQILSLEQVVTISSQNPKGVLYCDTLEWDNKRSLLRAKGNVRFDGESFTLGTAPEIWATPDLSVIATPDQFKP